jgi:orotate phosphoribosyltransferase-like protein
MSKYISNGLPIPVEYRDYLLLRKVYRLRNKGMTDNEIRNEIGKSNNE